MTKSIILFALFDVLGFKNLLENKGLDSIYNKYQQIIKLTKSQRGSFYSGKVQYPLSYSYKKQEAALISLGYLNVEHAYFSDTIIFWSKYGQH